MGWFETQYIASLLVMWLVVSGNAAWASSAIDLKGQWRFRTDAADKGVADRWFAGKLPETIKLPGSMAENGKGSDITLQTKWTGSIYDSSWYFNPRMAKYRQPGNLKFPFWLTPVKEYVGAAWYQKDVTIPANWANQHIELFLERPHTETRVWIDDAEIGMQNSLVAPHVFDLTGKLPPGKHTLTIRIDNRIKDINVGKDSHSLTDHTQGNWNGIVGRMELQAMPPVRVDDVQVYPDLMQKLARVKVTINSLTPNAAGTLRIAASAFNTAKKHVVPPVLQSFTLNGTSAILDIVYPMGDGLLTWDEFDPALYQLQVSVRSGQQEHRRAVQFGMREVGIQGTRFTVNGRPVYLRGTVENCDFPLTGYAAMDVPAWERIFRIARQYGLNHMRFHSYCPPEAAFIAADKVGFYLQPEGPSWCNHGTSLGDGKPVDKYLYDETDRMARSYGNYASYCLLAYGNEPAGRNQAKWLGAFCTYWMAKDPRRKYTGASVGMSWPLVPENEFMVKSGPRNLPYDKLPESTGDYRSKLEGFTVPYLTHEMGQWCATPNFKEIKKYTGVYRARNMELFQEDLTDRGMGDQGDQFLMASGKLQVLCYKQEIEWSLRTPGGAGFQLLSLNDYSGQGTALVGLLDAFWDEKGYVNAKAFRKFCSETVPLARLPKFVYRSDETMEAAVELAHFGRSPLTNARLIWTLTGPAGKVVARGAFAPQSFSIGTNQPVGTVSVPLAAIQQATKLTLEVSMPGTAVANSWEVWVYPATLPALAEDDIYVTTTLDEKAETVLKNGGKVFLQAAGKIEKGKEVVQHFLPVFWNTSWFKMRPPHTLGFVVNPAHPAFGQFPTDPHSNLQWWEIVHKAQVMNLEDFPASFRPIVQPIDTWFLNRRLGMILETKVGAGKLMLCSADLLSDPDHRIVARQLFRSLRAYMQTAAFAPETSVDLTTIRALFNSPSRDTFKAFTADSPDELKKSRM
ncbi:beta-glucuronidase [Arsenicibacter rosenii]|uniref:beta-galactosidase n=2 Tax=Arsenicibacter rosenii TaxID=1750698 RepID=A0A1S2VKC1_9BACT|nr:beta-glucuronidase [Arsenicibacter rosenii]